MKILSVFIDETGDFGAFDKKAPYYGVTLVFHDQSDDISSNIVALDQHVANLDYPQHTIHVGPIIRREGFYENDTREQRRSLFNALFHFSRRLPIRYLFPYISKRELDPSDETALQASLSRAIATDLKDNMDFFSVYDKIIVYYDNGQHELRRILVSVFNTLFSTVEFRKIKTSDYRLQQAADLVCTLELTNLKYSRKTQSRSEDDFFGSHNLFHKNIYRFIRKKHL